MPGYLGGGGGGGAGGEIDFPKELIDPVTKLRVSQPENLIDTDFEYGLQPTKWETLELINNTPSFFSKSGDTTIDGIVSITTNAGTREITVKTALDHGLAVGIPLNVTGSKSITADGAYIINSIPDSQTFTYLCKDNQPDTLSIEDLYTSIITGEFFQGSQIRISDAGGMTTDNATPESTITVTLDSTHGFGTNTPFYFLNLNSSLSQQFDASNSSSKSFDASNTATAQTFDGSNTLSSVNIDYSNSATLSGTVSNITNTDIVTNEITVQHTTENFANRPLGTPLYYSVLASSGFFSTNPRGVVFLKTITDLGASSSTFQVSATPDGEAIEIVATFTGTFQLANQARTFAGNNRNPLTEIPLTIVKEAEFVFDGNNQGYAGVETNGLCTVEGYSGTILVSTPSGEGLDYYSGAMVRYESTGDAATGLVDGATYFINSFVPNANIPNLYNITIRALPNSTSNITPSGGSGVQTFQKIGVSIDKDIVHIKNSNFVEKDMIEYTFPEGARFTAETLEQTKTFYFVQTAYDSHNYQLGESLFSPTVASGGVTSTYTTAGLTFRTHTFTTVGTTNFVVSSVGTDPSINYLVVAGGGSGGLGTPLGYEAGGGGGGGVLRGNLNVTATTYPIVVGAGGNNANGGNSTAFGLTAVGGGRGASGGANGFSGGSGGGGAHANTAGGAGTVGQGFAGATPGQTSSGGGGGGAGEAGNTDGLGHGGDGVGSNISGNTLFYGGGGAAFHAPSQGNNIGAIVGEPGVGGGGSGNMVLDSGAGLFAANKNAVVNTGGGGGGAYHTNSTGGGIGGSGIVIVSYPITPPPAIVPPVATGGNSTTDVTINKIVYRVHQYTTVGTSTFTVTSPGNQAFEYLVIAGGGGGGTQHGSGGGAGGYRCSVPGELSGRLSPAEQPLSLSAGVYSVTVGGGGAGAPGSSAQGVRGFRGGNSSFHTITSIGGGGGGSWAADNGADRASGGSGGGGWVTSGGGNNPGGAGTAGQGFNGGDGPPTPSQPHVGSGGGGAGGTGDIGKTSERKAAGRGGIGIPSNITGVPTYRASGGGGACYWSSGQTQPIRAEAREGGGGRGGMSFQSDQGAGTDGLPGAPNTGGGGGATGQYERTGGAGGSGIVIIRYPIATTA
jgi:hypothetical protein